jgi:hypothetical protein
MEERIGKSLARAGLLPTVPFHAGRDFSPVLVRKMAADIHPTVDEFLGSR